MSGLDCAKSIPFRCGMHLYPGIIRSAMKNSKERHQNLATSSTKYLLLHSHPEASYQGDITALGKNPIQM